MSNWISILVNYIAKLDKQRNDKTISETAYLDAISKPMRYLKQLYTISKYINSLKD